jgi:copper chaperone
MSIQLKVPSIVCEVCADNITKGIKNKIMDAQVTVDIETKIVTVETQASTDKIKDIIFDLGHTLE